MKYVIGYALCASYCTFEKSLEEMKNLADNGYDIVPIMSGNAYNTDTRFGLACEIRENIKSVCGKDIISTVEDAEPLGPNIKLDAMIVSPCTGNTLAKITYGITDTPVTMAVKAHMRNDRPVVIALASNDALSANLKNIGMMLERKNVYFVPFGQDDTVNKPHSLVADFTKLGDTLKFALDNRQIQPLLIKS
jgi:Archaeal flavoproteins